MRQSGDWNSWQIFDPQTFMKKLTAKISTLDIEQARSEVAPFVKDPDTLNIWSKEFFSAITERIEIV